MPRPSETDVPKPASVHRSRKAKRSKRRSRLAVPAGLVFYVTAGLGLASAALVYLWGDAFLLLSASVCVLILSVLILNERAGFTRSRRLRRSGEHRVNFEEWEVGVLFALLLLEVFVSVHAWVA